MKSGSETAANRFLILLLAIDAIFILLHFFHTFSTSLQSPVFSIKIDWSYSEVFQYTKELWIIMLLLWVAKSKRSLLYICWAFLFVYLMADDCLLLRERLSLRIGEFLGLRPMLGLRVQDVGEFVVSVLFGIPFLAMLGVAHYLSSKTTRTNSKRLFTLLVLLILFGVVIDMLPVAVKHHHFLLGPMVGTVEDGGEMVVMSFICAFVFALSAGGAEPTSSVEAAGHAR